MNIPNPPMQQAPVMTQAGRPFATQAGGGSPGGNNRFNPTNLPMPTTPGNNNWFHNTFLRVKNASAQDYYDAASSLQSLLGRVQGSYAYQIANVLGFTGYFNVGCTVTSCACTITKLAALS